MQHRFFDIVAENEHGEYDVSGEYILDLPEHDMSTSVERQEFLGIMFDAVVAASGLNISSFRSEEVHLV